MITNYKPGVSLAKCKFLKLKFPEINILVF